MNVEEATSERHFNESWMDFWGLTLVVVVWLQSDGGGGSGGEGLPFSTCIYLPTHPRVNEGRDGTKGRGPTLFSLFIDLFLFLFFYLPAK